MMEYFKVLQLLLSIGQIKTKSLECKLLEILRQKQPACSISEYKSWPLCSLPLVQNHYLGFKIKFSISFAFPES